MRLTSKASLVAGILALSATVVLLGGPVSAGATTDVLSAPGGQGGYTTVYYSTARTFTHSTNNARFEITVPGSDYNPSFAFGLRPGTAHSGVYARTGDFKAGTGYHYATTSSGSTTLGSGTFYLSTTITGCMGPVPDCFGAQSGYGYWSGYIDYFAAP